MNAMKMLDIMTNAEGVNSDKVIKYLRTLTPNALVAVLAESIPSVKENSSYTSEDSLNKIEAIEKIISL